VATLSTKQSSSTCDQAATPRLVLAACQPADARTPDANVKLTVLLRDAHLDQLDSIKAGVSRIKSEDLNALQSVRRSEQTCVSDACLCKLALALKSPVRLIFCKVRAAGGQALHVEGKKCAGLFAYLTLIPSNNPNF
jgi:hypothetical protein